MDGPDLSHLLDDANSEKPSRDVLHGIVRRRRRLQARRARTAATLGLVIALAGAGVGIGVSRQGGTTTSALPKHPNQLPTMSNRTAMTAPSPVSPGGAPEGLGWVNAGSGVGHSNLASPSPEATTGGEGSGELQVTSTGAGTSLCSVWNCSPYSPYGLIGDAVLRHLFTRTSDGVTVRAFTAVWVAAPLELVPTASGSSSTTTETPVTTGAEPSSSVATSSTRVLHVSCAVTQALLVEVSDAGAVGVIAVPLGPSLAQPIDVLSDQVVAVAEKSPIAVVVAHTAGQTAAVRAKFAVGGQDEMAVVDQWAVLVHKLTAAEAGGTGSQGSATPGQAAVYALSGTGTVLEHSDLPGSGALAMAVAACSAFTGGVHKVPGASPSGSPGSTRSGATGSSSSGAPATSGKPIGG